MSFIGAVALSAGRWCCRRSYWNQFRQNNPFPFSTSTPALATTIKITTTTKTTKSHHPLTYCQLSRFRAFAIFTRLKSDGTSTTTNHPISPKGRSATRCWPRHFSASSSTSGFDSPKTKEHFKKTKEHSEEKLLDDFMEEEDSDENEQKRQQKYKEHRLGQINKLGALGHDPYPHKFHAASVPVCIASRSFWTILSSVLGPCRKRHDRPTHSSFL